MADWWEKPYRIVQTNLREIDATLNPKEVVQSVKDFNANCLLFNVGGIIAFYPTELKYHHRNDFLESDVLGEVIEEAHAQEVKVIGRFDFSKATRKVYVDHPDWCWHTREGKPVIYNDLYHTCINGGWYREYSKDILSEALSKYQLDGLFFNMFGYQVRDYSRNYWGVCHCPGCQRRFRGASGLSLPDTEDWDDPSFPAYVQFRRDTSVEVAAMIYDYIKGIRPDIGVMMRFDKSDLLRGELNRAVDRGFPEWGHGAGQQAKWCQGFGKGKSYSSTLVHFVDIPYRFAADGPGCQGLRMAQQLAHGAQPDYYVLGTLDQEDTKPYDLMKEFFKHHEDNEELYIAAQPVAKVGLYHSELTQSFQGEGSVQYESSFRGAYKALTEAHIPFNLISDRRMNDPDIADQLKRYDVILLANVANLNAGECEILDAYVDAGGRLIATYKTGLFNQKGEPLSDFALKSLGVQQVEWIEEDVRSAYIRIEEDIPGFENTNVVTLDQGYVYATTKDGAKERFKLIPPQKYGPLEKCYPTDFSSRPGVVQANYGTGRTIYIPWQINWLYFRHGLEDYRNLLANLAVELSPDAKVVETNAPPQVEIAVYEQDGRYQLRLVNFSGHQQTAYHPPIPIHGIELKLDLSFQPNTVRAAVLDRELDHGNQGRQVTLTLPRLNYYEVITISAQ